MSSHDTMPLPPQAVYWVTWPSDELLYSDVSGPLLFVRNMDFAEMLARRIAGLPANIVLGPPEPEPGPNRQLRITQGWHGEWVKGPESVLVEPERRGPQLKLCAEAPLPSGADGVSLSGEDGGVADVVGI